MTTIQKYVTPGSHNLHIPTNKEFHRYAVEKLTNTDFCTETPTGTTAQRIASSITWTKKISSIEWQIWKTQYYIK